MQRISKANAGAFATALATLIAFGLRTWGPNIDLPAEVEVAIATVISGVFGWIMVYVAPANK